MSRIGYKTLNVTQEMIDRLLAKYLSDIDKAYRETEGALTVAIALKYSPNKEGQGIDIGTSINFIKERVKDSLEGSFDEDQGTLFYLIEDEPDDPPATRDVEIVKVDAEPEEYARHVCRACLDAGTAKKAYVMIIDRGACLACGAKDRRLYFEAVQ